MISEEPADLQATIEQTDSGEQQYVLRALCDHLSGIREELSGIRTLLEPRLVGTGWQAIGPAPAPRSRIAGLSRWQLLLHGPDGSPLPLPPEADLRRSLPRAVHLTIDPDPLEL